MACPSRPTPPTPAPRFWRPSPGLQGTAVLCYHEQQQQQTSGRNAARHLPSQLHLPCTCPATALHCTALQLHCDSCCAPPPPKPAPLPIIIFPVSRVPPPASRSSPSSPAPSPTCCCTYAYAYACACDGFLSVAAAELLPARSIPSTKLLFTSLFARSLRPITTSHHSFIH